MVDVVLLGFGEPDGSSYEETVAYLERIFLANASLEDSSSEEARRARCRDLASRRAPGLHADYERIGGSPLLAQCRQQALDLGAKLADRGMPVRTTLAMQFTRPYIADVAAELAATGADLVIGLPLYPLCGTSTTVAALDGLTKSFEPHPHVRLLCISGWHAHPSYVRAVVERVSDTAERAGAKLTDADTMLYFSAHGTPVKYLEEGSRYDRYVEESCRQVATALGVEHFALGYQNHANRGLKWTEPANEELLPTLSAKRLVVVPISFVHEQSETLVELDEDLRELAGSLGMEFLRVPAPHDADGLIEAWADLIEETVAAVGRAGTVAHGETRLRRCVCRPVEGTYCLNGDRDV